MASSTLADAAESVWLSLADLTVTVVTPWLNNHDLLPSYNTLIDAGRPERVVIVDNASDPPLAPWTPHVSGNRYTIRLKRNEGFCRASNIGVEWATGDALLFLNNDVALQWQGADWLAPIRQALRPGLLVGAKLRTEPHGDVDGNPHAYLDGWCLAAMRKDWDRIGGWDTTLEEPAYYSDNLLSLKARSLGMRLVEVPVPLIHLENGTSRLLDPAHVWEVTQRNKAVFEAKARQLTPTAVGQPCPRCAEPLVCQPDTSAPCCKHPERGGCGWLPALAA